MRVNGMERVYQALVALEDELEKPVSAFQVNEALARGGHPVRSYRAAIARLRADRRVWVAGVGYAGRNRRHTHVYTAREDRRSGRQSEIGLPLRIPAELRRAVRDVTAAVRSTADALARLDEIIDAGIAGATATQVAAIERRNRQQQLAQRLDERLPRRLDGD